MNYMNGYMNYHSYRDDTSDHIIPFIFDDWINHDKMVIPDDSFKVLLRVNSIVDAQDEEGKWYASQIIEFEHFNRYKVHFFGWNQRFNEIVHITNLKPLYTFTNNWRKNLKVGSELEIKISMKPNHWFQATIINHNMNMIDVIMSYHIWCKDKVPIYSFDIKSEDLSELGVHTWRPNCDVSLRKKYTHYIIYMRYLCLSNRAYSLSNENTTKENFQHLKWLCESAPYWVIIMIIPHLLEPRYFRCLEYK